MEFTIPLGKPLRPPAHEDAAWLGFRWGAQSDDTSYEPADESLEGYNNFNRGEMDLSVAPWSLARPGPKARRPLVPRKSILKTSLTPDDPESQPTQSTWSTHANPDDNDVTQPAQGIRANIRGSTSRKSSGRRVSFAEHAHVRLFQIPYKNQPKFNAGSPHTSSSQTSSDLNPPSAQVNDENRYLQESSACRWRGSVHYSVGSEDMDITTVTDFLPGSAILDEKFDDEGLSEDTGMEVMPGTCKRSLSIGHSVPRKSILKTSLTPNDPESQPTQSTWSTQANPDDNDVTQPAQGIRANIRGSTSRKSSDRRVSFAEHAHVRLFQIPYKNQPKFNAGSPSSQTASDLNPPSAQVNDENRYLQESSACRWRGSVRYSVGSEDMDITTVTDFLPGSAILDEKFDDEGLSEDTGMEVIPGTCKRSLSIGHSASQLPPSVLEDTLSSVGSVGSEDAGNCAVNFSKVPSRMSMGHEEASVDESEVCGDIVTMRRQSVVPRQSLPPSSAGPSLQPTKDQEAPPPVVRPPLPSPQPSPARPPPKPLTDPSPFSLNIQLASSTFKQPTSQSSYTPSKAKLKPTFTPAFAPPATRTSPKKSQKRPYTNENEAHAEQPSPAKRQALAGKWFYATVQSRTEPPSSLAGGAAPKPRPLSCSENSPLQSMGTQQSRQPSSSSGLQRPKGYMARRKSLAAAPNPATPASKHPKKSAGRIGLASALQHAWARFDQDTHLPSKNSVQIREDSERPEVDQAPLEDETLEPEERTPSPTPQPTVVRIVEPESPKSGSGGLGTADDREFGGDEDDETSTLLKAERWRESVEDGPYDEEEEVIPVISIEQFFQMTDTAFEDELIDPRRSVHPLQHPTRRPREPQDIALSAYMVAMAIDIPQLELYTLLSRDLEAWMEKIKSVFAAAEDEAAKVTPELFVEYAQANEQEQAELSHQLKLMKINARGLAKSDWYAWKLKWVEGLKTIADQAFADLESDARNLEALSAEAFQVIPDLEREYEQVMAELEREQAEVAEIEACDQHYLSELKNSIAEQNIEVDHFKAELIESNDQLNCLEERLQEMEVQKREIQASIAEAERFLQIQKRSTRAEVSRLKDELEALEELHMVRVVKTSSQAFEYIYDSALWVIIPCENFRPVVSKIAVSRLEHTSARAKDDFPQLSSLFLDCAIKILADDEDTTVPKTIHKLNDYWTSCAQLRSQLRLLNAKYPIAIDINVEPTTPSSGPTFRVRATVLFPKVAGKAIVSYMFDIETFCQWPSSIRLLVCDVDISYGPLDRKDLLDAVVGSLTGAKPSNNRLFLDSCIDAQRLYT